MGIALTFLFFRMLEEANTEDLRRERYDPA
jgi:hypothetical protein